MKLNAGNITVGSALVGLVWFTAALAADVNKNSIHTLQANVDRWQYLVLSYKKDNPEPRSVEIQAQIIRWEQEIKLALAEIESRQEKD